MALNEDYKDAYQESLQEIIKISKDMLDYTNSRDAESAGVRRRGEKFSSAIRDFENNEKKFTN